MNKNTLNKLTKIKITSNIPLARNCHKRNLEMPMKNDASKRNNKLNEYPIISSNKTTDRIQKTKNSVGDNYIPTKQRNCLSIPADKNSGSELIRLTSVFIQLTATVVHN